MDLLLAPAFLHDGFFSPAHRRRHALRRRRAHFDPFFGPLVASSHAWPALPHSSGLHLEFSEAADGYGISADLPGVQPEQLSVKLTGDGLQIRLQHSAEDERTFEGGWTKSSSSSFVQRTVGLPEDADTDNMLAELRPDGHLVIQLPRLAIEDAAAEEEELAARGPVPIAIEREGEEVEGMVEDVEDGDEA